MKPRYIVLAIGLAFAVTLAVVIGQRLSSEAMAVMVGVVAGVAASIPTSLIVVMLTSRYAIGLRPGRPVTAPPPAPEPRIIVMQQPVGQMDMTGYALPYPLPQQMAATPTFAPRQFNVIGGAELFSQEVEPEMEVVWPQ